LSSFGSVIVGKASTFFNLDFTSTCVHIRAEDVCGKCCGLVTDIGKLQDELDDTEVFDGQGESLSAFKAELDLLHHFFQLFGALDIPFPEYMVQRWDVLFLYRAEKIGFGALNEVQVHAAAASIVHLGIAVATNASPTAKDWLASFSEDAFPLDWRLLRLIVMLRINVSRTLARNGHVMKTPMRTDVDMGIGGTGISTCKMVFVPETQSPPPIEDPNVRVQPDRDLQNTPARRDKERQQSLALKHTRHKKLLAMKAQRLFDRSVSKFGPGDYSHEYARYKASNTASLARLPCMSQFEHSEEYPHLLSPLEWSNQWTPVNNRVGGEEESGQLLQPYVHQLPTPVYHANGVGGADHRLDPNRVAVLGERAGPCRTHINSSIPMLCPLLPPAEYEMVITHAKGTWTHKIQWFGEFQNQAPHGKGVAVFSVGPPDPSQTCEKCPVPIRAWKNSSVLHYLGMLP
jgi:hypothetical protein